MGNKSYFRYFVLKILFQALYLGSKRLKSTLGLQDKIAVTKKPWTKIYEILELGSPTIRQKYLFYTLCWHFFSLQSIAQGNCEPIGRLFFDMVNCKLYTV